MKIKVLHVVLSMETGGLENGIVNLVNNSDQDNFIVDILCLRNKGELADRITNPQSKIIFDDDDVNHSLMSAVSKIKAAGDYDIIHSHGFTTMLASYLANFFNTKCLLINGEHGTLYYKTLKQRIIQRFLFNRMDLNLTVCKDLKLKVFKEFGVKKDNFLPIINGVDTEKFQPKCGTAFRNELNIPEDHLIIGSVGRLVPGKDFPTLIKAFYQLAKVKPDIHLVLVGDGPERKKLESLRTELNLVDNLHLTGRRDDVPSLINTMDLFVLPSLSEGLSNTLLEAMSSGIPVIGANVGGNPEIIKEDYTGYLFEAGNIESLVSILLPLVKNPKKIEALSLQARNHILDNFSLSSMVKNYEDTYMKIITNR